MIQMRFWSWSWSPPSAKTASQSPSRSTSPKSTFSVLELLADPLVGMALGYRLIKPETRARNRVETFIRWMMIICASIAILTTVGIVMSVALVKSLREDHSAADEGSR